MNLQPQHTITDAANRPVAVVLDIDTFRHIEETLENFGLYTLMQEESFAEDMRESLSLEDAKKFYQALLPRK